MKQDSEERRAALADILSDADQVWESIGPDGIKYNFNTNMLRMDEAQRQTASLMMGVVDRKVARTIAAAIVDRNSQALGALIINQVERYFEDKIDAIIEQQEREE